MRHLEGLIVNPPLVTSCKMLEAGVNPADEILANLKRFTNTLDEWGISTPEITQYAELTCNIVSDKQCTIGFDYNFGQMLHALSKLTRCECEDDTGKEIYRALIPPLLTSICNSIAQSFFSRYAASKGLSLDKDFALGTVLCELFESAIRSGDSDHMQQFLGIAAYASEFTAAVLESLSGKGYKFDESESQPDFWKYTRLSEVGITTLPGQVHLEEQWLFRLNGQALPALPKDALDCITPPDRTLANIVDAHFQCITTLEGHWEYYCSHSDDPQLEEELKKGREHLIKLGQELSQCVGASKFSWLPIMEYHSQRALSIFHEVFFEYIPRSSKAYLPDLVVNILESRYSLFFDSFNAIREYPLINKRMESYFNEIALHSADELDYDALMIEDLKDSFTPPDNYNVSPYNSWQYCQIAIATQASIRELMSLYTEHMAISTYDKSAIAFYSGISIVDEW